MFQARTNNLVHWKLWSNCCRAEFRNPRKYSWKLLWHKIAIMWKMLTWSLTSWLLITNLRPFLFRKFCKASVNPSRSDYASIIPSLYQDQMQFRLRVCLGTYHKNHKDHSIGFQKKHHSKKGLENEMHLKWKITFTSDGSLNLSIAFNRWIVISESENKPPCIIKICSERTQPWKNTEKFFWFTQE